MYTLALILIIIACVLLVFIVLVQNSKGGGLASNFSAGNQFGGVAQTNKFLERGTWTLAIAVLVFSLTASLSISKGSQEVEESELKDIIENYDYSVPPTTPVENIVPGQDTENE